MSIIVDILILAGALPAIVAVVQGSRWSAPALWPARSGRRA